MFAPSRIAVALILLSLAGGLVACGEREGNSAQDKNVYVDQINAAQSKFASAVTHLKESINQQSTPGEDRRTLGRFEGTITDVVATLRSIKVPSDVSKPHAMLIAAFTGFGSDIAVVTKALRKQTVHALEDGQRKLGAATITVNEKLRIAREAINTRLGAS